MEDHDPVAVVSGKDGGARVVRKKLEFCFGGYRVGPRCQVGVRAVVASSVGFAGREEGFPGRIEVHGNGRKGEDYFSTVARDRLDRGSGC